MTTFKRLGLKMTRDGSGGWTVRGEGFSGWEGKGNKGFVMDDCLRNSGAFKLEGGRWKRLEQHQ